MVDKDKLPSGAGAGRFIHAERDKLRKEQQAMAAIREEMELMLQRKDEDIQMLFKESERSKEAIDELRKQQEIMKADSEKALRRSEN